MGERIIVCGSRDYDDLDLVVTTIFQMPLDTTLIVGGARGPDKVAEEAARQRGMQVEVYRADWAQFGRAAGMIRNGAMLAAQPDRIIAFHDGSSRGTAMMIHEARKREIPLTVYNNRHSGDSRFPSARHPSASRTGSASTRS